MTAPRYKFWGWDRQREHELENVAATIERGEDGLAAGWSGGRYSEAHWIIDILLDQLGRKVSVDEDGNVCLISAKDPEEIDPIYPTPVQKK